MAPELLNSKNNLVTEKVKDGHFSNAQLCLCFNFFCQSHYGYLMISLILYM